MILTSVNTSTCVTTSCMNNQNKENYDNNNAQKKHYKINKDKLISIVIMMTRTIITNHHYRQEGKDIKSMI